MAAASTSDRRFPRPTVAWALALLVSLLVGASVRADDNVYVQQEGTPIVSKPGVGGKILGWVGTGFPLTVHGREGDWLEVSSSLLTFPSESLWVPAARVGDRLPGAFDIAYAPDGQSVGPGGAFFQLEIGGTPDTRVRANCRAERGRDDAFRRIIDDVPAALDVDGDAVDCVVRKLESDGWVDVVLRGPDGTIVAGASTYARRGAVRVRSDGSWGAAAGFALPARFVLFKDPSKIDLPSGGPVPPLGNPVPPLGSSVPSLGNPVPPLASPTAAP
jgi:hypothetical protein